MRPTQMVGLALWRSGLLLVGIYVLYETIQRVLFFLRVPSQLATGIVLIIAGVVLVILSLILERVRDARAEGDLRK